MNRSRARRIRGNVVMPTRNPFDATSVRSSLEETIESLDPEHVLVLGRGLYILLDHVLEVDDHGIIRRLDPAADQREDITYDIRLGPHDFLCPGMIDLHIHAPQFAYTGTATDRPLMGPEGWLETYTFPAERRLRDNLDLAQRVYRQVVQTTLQAGTTTAVYFATLDLEPCKVLVDQTLEQGQRAFVGKVCMDRNSPDDYCQTLEQNLAETKALMAYIDRQFDEGDASGQRSRSQLVHPILTPRFIPTCSPELLSALGDLAKEHDCHITSHISESLDEVAYSRHLDATVDLKDGAGRSDTAIFDSHGLLTDKCIMAHGVHLGDEDLDQMKAQGSAVAHCPLSNFFFAGGSLPCRKLLERGNLVGLGTDVAGGYHPSLMHSSRMAVVASLACQHQQHGEATKASDSTDVDTSANHTLDYRHAFYLATLGGAAALKMQDRIGTLGVGMEFDAVILSPATSPICIFEDHESLADIFQKLCVLGDDRNIQRVFVQGRDVTAK